MATVLKKKVQECDAQKFATSFVNAKLEGSFGLDMEGVLELGLLGWAYGAAPIGWAYWARPYGPGLSSGARGPGSR